MSFFRRAGALIARFFNSAVDPAAVATEFKLYSKDDGGVSQLFGRSDDGTVHQITPPASGGAVVHDATLVGDGSLATPLSARALLGDAAVAGGQVDINAPGASIVATADIVDVQALQIGLLDPSTGLSFLMSNSLGGFLRVEGGTGFIQLAPGVTGNTSLILNDALDTAELFGGTTTVRNKTNSASLTFSPLAVATLGANADLNLASGADIAISAVGRIDSIADNDNVVASNAAEVILTGGTAVIIGSNGAPMKFFDGVSPVTRPNVTGSRGGNAALASLLTELANLGLITDGTSP